MGKCHGDALPHEWWRVPELLIDEVHAHGSQAAASRAHPEASNQTISKWWGRYGLGELPVGRAAASARPDPVQSRTEPLDVDRWLLAELKRSDGNITVSELADVGDMSPRRVRESLERLGDTGYRVSEDDGERVMLSRVPPDTTNLHPGLFDGQDHLFGVVSDTHLCSTHHAGDELELAYDMFEREGVTDVLHAGDLVSGRGIFRGQEQEVVAFTLDDQVEYAVTHYPSRDGIRTRLIGGNHDLEGDAAKVGFDLAAAVSARRDDLDYLGPFSAWLGVGDDPETAPWVHLLHGRGGMSYAYSYKAQKLVDGYPAGRKPSLLICGHWHVRGAFEARSVEVLFPGCFEWQSRFMQRLGLQPAVGFHLLELRFGDDGSLVRCRPVWFKFHAGRVVG